jgi:hydrogenase/urease accessory protein HupE
MKYIIFILLLIMPLQAHAHHGITGASPSMGTCGITPSVSGNDSVGTITVGSGVVTSCAMNFASTWTTTPICVSTTDSATISSGITSLSTTVLTVGLSATLGSGHIYYLCWEKQ